MKAIQVHQWGGPEVLQLQEVPDPHAGPGQVVVRVKAAGVNPIEAYIRAGLYSRVPPLPYTPGADAAGVVEDVGSGVTGISRGDRVYTAGTITGSYAELALCDANMVHRLPENVSFAQGAALGVPYATAYQGLFNRAQAKAGETVLVHGATGGVGIAGVQLARAAGLTVIGTGGSESGRELVAREGAHLVFDHHSPGYLDGIKEVSDGGVNVIFEMLANVNLGKDLGILARGGRVVVIGSRGPVEIDPRLTMGSDLDIRGMTLFNATECELKGIHAALIAGLENGSLRPVIGTEIPLAEAPRAHEAVMGSKANGKIVLIP